MNSAYTIIIQEKHKNGKLMYPEIKTFEVGTVAKKGSLLIIHEEDSERIDEIKTVFTGDCMKYGGVYKEVEKLLKKEKPIVSYKTKSAVITLLVSDFFHSKEEEIFRKEEDFDD